ncbi:hypothetical protein [Dokdonia sp. Hel_I_53]|uniref:hypothetical protein n=1 Tax=Dokdonia sp. Hel_I_53 TaxID=1566287 RepID=UPI00119963E6|nr:hypothetical protein [Dokdonia sp. Hel_I_53]TVZ52386.1 hypothetical protein OD90_1561 [Dokdonia sp. Hel_I_53]
MIRFIKIYSLVIILPLIFSESVFSQEFEVEKKNDFWNKVHFGGGLGLNFSRGYTQISVSPSALYQPNSYIAYGPGLNYSFQKFGDYKTSLIGGSAIFLYNPTNFLQLSTEIEQLRVSQSIDGEPDIPNFWNTGLFVGAGYRLNIGGQGLGAIGIRYNLLYNDNDSVYADAWLPFVRVYF